MLLKRTPKLWMFNIIKGGINFVLLQKIAYFTIILYSYVCTVPEYSFLTRITVYLENCENNL